MIQLFSASIHGIHGNLIEVEVDVTTGMGQFSIVGLGDAAVLESRERVRSAIKNSGYTFPAGARITVNLAPADLKKRGPIFDLPIALGILGKDVELNSSLLLNSLFLGELSLDGSLRSIPGVLPIAILAREKGIKRLILPHENVKEASIIPDVEVIGASKLQEVVDYLEKNIPIKALDYITSYREPLNTKPLYDFQYIFGQESAKRGLLIAAAGGHNIILEGPPGSGKTLLAKALSSILPPMELEEKIELSRIYSVAGLLRREQPLVQERPFRLVHHTASEASIIGGGRDSRPGEISLAHKGVLFLDEFLEFPKQVLETLRQPIEDGEITINRVHQTSRYPAQFSLVGATNPCPCGYFGDKERECSCSPHAIERYRSHLSGPILDRVDLYIQVPRVKVGEIGDISKNVSSNMLREKVIQAKKLQQKRFEGKQIFSNAEMGNQDIESLANISTEAYKIAIGSTERLHLSTRVYYRILRVARTIADIESSPHVEVRHILEALSYRGMS